MFVIFIRSKVYDLNKVIKYEKSISVYSKNQTT